MYTIGKLNKIPSGNSTTYSTSDPVTGSIAPNADDSLIVAILIYSGGTDRTGGAPTFGGTTMLQADTARHGNTSPEASTEMWYLTASAVNAQYITGSEVSVPNGDGVRVVVHLVTAKAGAGKTAAVNVTTGSSNATTSTNPYCKITTTAGSTIIFESIGTGANSWAPTARTLNFVNIQDNDIGVYGGGAQYLITNTTGVITGSWTFGTGEDWGIVMAAFGERGAIPYPYDTTQSQTSDNIDLTQHEPPYLLVVDNSTQTQTSDNIELSQIFSINTKDALQTQTADNLTLTAYEPTVQIIPNSVNQLQTSDNILLIQNYSLVMHNGVQAQSSSNISLAQNYILSVQDASQLQKTNFFIFTDGYGGDVTSYFDTYVQADAATTNYGSNEWLSCRANGASNGRNALLKFNLSSIPSDAICTSATLTLNYWVTGVSSTHSFYEILSQNSGWTETGATWNTKDGTNAWAGGNTGCWSSGVDRSATAIASRNIPEVTQYQSNPYDFDLTPSLVEEWFGTTNYGIVGCNDNDWFNTQFGSSDNSTTIYRPKLVVQYILPIILTQHNVLLVNNATQTQILSILNISPTLRTNGARYYNGTTNKITYPSVGNLTASAFTMSVWFKLERISTTYQIIFGVNNSTNDDMVIYIANPNYKVGCLTLVIDGATGGWRTTSADSVLLDEWVNIIATWDGISITSIATHAKVYKNGIELTYDNSSNGVEPVKEAGGLITTGGYTVNETFDTKGAIGEAAIWNRVLSAGEISLIGSLEDLNSATNVPDGLIFCSHPDEPKDLITGNIGTLIGTILVNGPDLDFPDYSLTVQSAVQTQISSNVTLIQNHTLTIQNSIHTQASDNLTLTYNSGTATLAVQNSTQSESSDNIVLAQHHLLVINNIVQTQTSTNVVLVQHSVLSINNSVQTQTSDKISLTQHYYLSINNATQTQISSNISLLQHYILSVNNATQAQTTSNVDLTQHYMLVVNNVTQSQTTSVINLTQYHILSIQNAVQAQTADNIALTLAGILTVQNSLQTQTSDNIILVPFDLRENGARDFNPASSGRIDWNNVWDPAAHEVTIAAWVYLDAALPANDYIFGIHKSGNTAMGFVFNITSNAGVIQNLTFVKYGASQYYWEEQFPISGKWHHLMVTNDGGLSASATMFYLDGVSATSVNFVGGTGTENPVTGSYSIGGRIFDNTRHFDGRIGEVALWDRILTEEERALVSSGSILKSATYVSSGLKFLVYPDEAKDLISGEIGSSASSTTLDWGPDLDFPDYSLEINNTIQAQISGNITFAFNYTLTVENTVQSQTSDNITTDPMDMRINGARIFDGTTDRVDWTNKANLSGSPITVSAWVKFDTIKNSYILNSQNETNNDYGFLYNTGTAGNVMCFIRNRSTTYTSWITNAILNTNKWYHLLTTSKGESFDLGDVEHYLDGVLKNSIIGSIGSGDEIQYTGTWAVGGKTYADDRNLDGEIGEVAVWNRVLTTDEIAQLSSRTALTSAVNFPDGLVFCVHPDEPIDLVTHETGTLDGASTLNWGPDLDINGWFLVVSNATHGQTADSLTLTYHESTSFNLTVQSIIHSQTSENVILFAHYSIIIQNSVQEQLSNNVLLTQHHILFVQNSVQEQLSDEASSIQHQLLTTNDSIQIQKSDGGGFPNQLIIDNFNRGDLGTNWTVLSGTPVITSGELGTSSKTLEVEYNQTTFGPAVEFYITATNLPVLDGNTIQIKYNYKSSDGHYYFLFAQNLNQTDLRLALGKYNGDIVYIWTGNIYTYSTRTSVKFGIQHENTGRITIYHDIGDGWELIAEAFDTQELQSGTVIFRISSPGGTVVRVDDFGGNNLNAVLLTQHHFLTVNNTIQTQISENVNLTQNYILSVNNVVQSQISDNISLVQHCVLEIQNSIQTQVSNNIELTPHNPAGTLTIQNTRQTQTTSDITLDTLRVRLNGARDYNGTGDRIDYTTKYDPTSLPITISAWIFSDGWSVNADYIFEAHTLGDLATGLTFYVSGTNQIEFSRRGGTVFFRRGTGESLTGSWKHVLVTHDGTNVYTNVKLYIDGTECTYTAGTNGATVVSQDGSWSVGGRMFDNTRNFDGKIGEVAVWNRVLETEEISTISSRTVLKSATNIPTGLVFVEHPDEGEDLWTNEVGTITGTSLAYGPDLDFPDYELTTSGAVQTQTSDNVLLTQNYALSINNAVQSQTSDNIVLVQHAYGIVTPNNVTQVQTSDKVILTQHHILVINSVTQSQTSDKVILTQHHILVINSVTQSQTSDNVILTQRHILVINNAIQSQTSDNVILVQHSYNILNLNNAVQSQTSDKVSLTQKYVLGINNAVQAQSSDKVILNAIYGVSISNTVQTQTAQTIGLTQHHILAINNAVQTQTATSLTIYPAGSLVANNAVQLQSTSGISLVQHHILSVNSTTQIQTSDNIAVLAKYTLSVKNATQAQTSDKTILTGRYSALANSAVQTQTTSSIALVQKHVLIVNNATQTQTVDNLNISGIYTLTIQNARQAQSAGNVILSAHYIAIPNNAVQTQTSENVTLSAHYSILPNSAIQTQTVDNIITNSKYILSAIQNVTQTQTCGSVILSAHYNILPQNAVQTQTSDSIWLTQYHILDVSNTTQEQFTTTITLVFNPLYTTTEIPDFRTYTIVYENRNYIIEIEDRIYSIDAENRAIIMLKPEAYEIEEENRTFDIDGN